VLGTSLLLTAALFLPDYATWLAVGGAAVSVAGVTIEFWRGRPYYLDQKFRDKRLRQSAAARPV
jgi:hypothetical protein